MAALIRRASNKLTKARRVWLERVRDSPSPPQRPSNRVGFDCWQAGWTEWAYFNRATGLFIGNWEAAVAIFPRSTSHFVRANGEILTRAGRAALAEAAGELETL